MIRLTVYAKAGTHLMKDPVVQMVSSDLEGTECEIRLVERSTPCTLITFDESADTIP